MNYKYSVLAICLCAVLVVSFLFSVNDPDIHELAKTGDAAYILLLLKRSPELLEVRDRSGSTPLSIAVLYRRVKAVKVLVSAGASLDAKDSGGDTPLQDAKKLISQCNEKYFQKMELAYRKSGWEEQRVVDQMRHTRATRSPEAQKQWQEIAKLLEDEQTRRRGAGPENGTGLIIAE